MNTRISAIAIGILCMTLGAQSKGTKGTKPAKTRTQLEATTSSSKVVPGFQDEPFDLSVQRLQPSFAGVDTSKILIALEGIQDAHKDEYETTSEFDTRLAKLKGEPLVGNLHFGELTAFAIKQPTLERGYDADKGAMSLRLKTSNRLGTILKPSGYQLDRARFVLCLQEESQSKKAVFTNAFGASVEGDDLNAHVWNAIVPSFTPSNIEFPMPPDQARSLKDLNLSVLLIGALNSREVVKSAVSRDATIDSPTSFFELEHSLSFDPQEMWVYVVETGVVLYRQKIESTPLSRAGISLAQESFPLLGFSILAPGSFNSDLKTVGTYPNMVEITNNVASVPGVTVVVSQTEQSILPKDTTPPDLDASLAAYEKQIHPVEKAISGREVLGVPAKTMLAKINSGGHTFIERSAVFSILDYRGERKFIMVIVRIDFAIDKAEQEVERVFNSLSKSKY